MPEPFIGEIRMGAFNFAPRGWASCDGQVLPISGFHRKSDHHPLPLLRAQFHEKIFGENLIQRQPPPGLLNLRRRDLVRPEIQNRRLVLQPV